MKRDCGTGRTREGARGAGRKSFRCTVESLETRQLLTISFFVFAGGTLDIAPLSSIFPDSRDAYMVFQRGDIPGLDHGTWYKVDGPQKIKWGTNNSGGEVFAPISLGNRIYGGQGLEYINDGTGVGTSESVGVIFSSGDGFTGSADTIVINITSSVGAPSIVTQPLGLQSIVTGSHTTLSVAATGNGPLSYQWYTGLSPNTSNPIAGATASSYTTDDLGDLGQHFYWVQVWNAAGSVSSTTSTVKVGAAPIASAGGPYTIPERGSVTLNAYGSDPNNGLYILYECDFDGDGIYGETSSDFGDENGPNAVFNAGGGLDGPTAKTLSLKVTNEQGLSTFKTATINVTNLAPTATFTSNGTAGVVSFANQSDATADLASLKYSYDFNDDGVFDVVNTTATSATVPANFMSNYLFGTPVRGRVMDKDGGFTDYVANLHGSAILVTSLADAETVAASMVVTTGVTLRAAMTFADANADASNIAIDPSLLAGGNATLLLSQLKSSSLGGSALTVNTPITITAPYTDAGHQLTIGNAVLGSDRRAFYVLSPGNLTLENLALFNFSSRIADGALGGTIYNQGTLTLRRSTIAGSSAFSSAANAVSRGGAIYSDGGTVTVENSTFISDTASSPSVPSLGGAIFMHNGTLTIISSTLTSNTAREGRDVYLQGDGITGTATAIINNSILGQGDASFHDFTSTVINNGRLSMAGANNLIRSTTTFGGSYSTADPLLGSFGINGGPTPTVPILANSPALNAGATRTGITLDQRGIVRPQGGAPDIGAFERAATTATVLSASYESESRQAITMNFNNDASAGFGRGNYTLRNLTTGATITSSLGTVAVTNPFGTQMTLTLTNLLPDGRYRITFGSTFGGSTLDFAVLAGDFNGDGPANFNDLLSLAKNYGQAGMTFSKGDANYDGTVDFSDLLILAKDYNTSLPAPAAAAHADATTRKRNDVANDLLSA